MTILLGISLASCEDDNERDKNSIETDPITFNKDGEVYLLKTDGDTIKKLDVEFAESDYEKQTGLMYRESMEDEQGMLFIYNDSRVRNFYMKNTYIALDILYYATDSTLVSIQKNATPRDESNLPSEGPAQFVLEINAGLADEWGIKKGDKFSSQTLD